MYSIIEGGPRQWEAIEQGLTAYNKKQLGTNFMPPQKVTRVAVNEDGNLAGGILCTYLDILHHLYVENLWVDTRYRGIGIGNALLHEVEEYAREHSCILVQLETLDFQAKDYYITRGYAVFGELEGPPGHTCYFMKKDL